MHCMMILCECCILVLRYYKGIVCGQYILYIYTAFEIQHLPMAPFSVHRDGESPTPRPPALRMSCPPVITYLSLDWMSCCSFSVICFFFTDLLSANIFFSVNNASATEIVLQIISECYPQVIINAAPSPRQRGRTRAVTRRGSAGSI